MNRFIAITAGTLIGGIAAAQAQTKVDFAKDIQPILQQQCVKCHGPEKQKGKLRLDSKEAAFKGGKGGPAIVANDAAKSDLFRQIGRAHV